MDTKAPWASFQIWLFVLVAATPQLLDLFGEMNLPAVYMKAIYLVLGVTGIVARTMSSGEKIALPARAVK